MLKLILHYAKTRKYAIKKSGLLHASTFFNKLQNIEKR